MSEIFEKSFEAGNYAVQDSYAKAISVIHKSYSPVCSISGGSDSDIVLDIIQKVDKLKKVTYYWIDTGLEYQATKKHLEYLKSKYDIHIETIKPKKSIPTCVREYGVPFISKHVSEMIMRLQVHHFQWEDEPLEVLLKRYPNCKIALQWWCNAYYSVENGVQQMGKFSINRNKWLKEFIMQNPPDFPISNRCCEYAKKKPAKNFIKSMYADLEITGIRKSEGGVRSAVYKTCFSASKSKKCNTYRPIFWYSDSDKLIYEQFYGIHHSECYTKYGMERTGCVGCPFNPHIMEELEIIKNFEPKLYMAAINIFGKSYEYTRKYREFAKTMKLKEKETGFDSNQLSLFDDE